MFSKTKLPIRHIPSSLICKYCKDMIEMDLGNTNDSVAKTVHFDPTNLRCKANEGHKMVLFPQWKSITISIWIGPNVFLCRTNAKWSNNVIIVNNVNTFFFIYNEFVIVCRFDINKYDASVELYTGYSYINKSTFPASKIPLVLVVTLITQLVSSKRWIPIYSFTLKWSIFSSIGSGVNMYAMVTGSLPYTVEPFNIKALYNKMLNGDMNAIPSHLSKGGFRKKSMSRFGADENIFL